MPPPSKKERSERFKTSLEELWEHRSVRMSNPRDLHPEPNGVCTSRASKMKPCVGVRHQGCAKGFFFGGGKPQLTPVPLPHRWLPLVGTPETSSMHPLHKLKGVQLTRTPGQEPWQPRGSRVHAYIFGRRKIKLHIFLKVITDTHLRAT